MPLQQKTALKRTGFRSAARLAEPKPAKGEPKPRKCKNRACRQPFAPDPKHPFLVCCSEDCRLVVALAHAAKLKASRQKAERAETKRKKQEGISINERKEAVQKLVNKAAVLRDHADGCISCEKGPNWHGTWHGSHYKSVGSSSALRYNLWNIHKACSDCNWHRSGNIAQYEPRLVLKLGQIRAEHIKNHPRSREYDAEYLTRLAKVMRRLIKRYQRRIDNN